MLLGEARERKKKEGESFIFYTMPILKRQNNTHAKTTES